MAQKAVVLVSGGIDSAVTLAMAKEAGFAPYALAFLYGQKNRAELIAAQEQCSIQGVEDYRVLQFSLSALTESSLTNTSVDVPKDRTSEEMLKSVPSTYVPSRNIIFLSLASAWATTLNTNHIFIGIHDAAYGKSDHAGYPDSRHQFVDAFKSMLDVGTEMGQTREWHIHTPVMTMKKTDILHKGIELGVSLSMTCSCYVAKSDGDDAWYACGGCDACVLRAAAFKEAGLQDPTRYVHSPPVV